MTDFDLVKYRVKIQILTGRPNLGALPDFDLVKYRAKIQIVTGQI